MQENGRSFWQWLQKLNCHILPNTAGCYTAKDAITTAQMAREIFATHWIKLEVIGDTYTLQPDPFALVAAARELIAQGFEVFPYCTEDLVVAEKLVALGCRILMPWAAPIGSAQGILNPLAIKTLRHRLPDVTLIIDAGIGAPSHAAFAMELGVDAVLVNTAVALAENPSQMAQAFAHAVEAGHLAYRSGLIEKREFASPSTPVIGTPFWQQQETDHV
jgi:thiazole synthase